MKLGRAPNLRTTHGNALVMRRSAAPVLSDRLGNMNGLELTSLEASALHACDGIAAISSPVPHAVGLPTADRHYQPPEDS
jgi:hypothetical protein